MQFSILFSDWYLLMMMPSDACLSQDLTDKSALVQVMAWCRQATSHYLSQCLPRSLQPNGITSPQWVKISYCLPFILPTTCFNPLIIHISQSSATCWAVSYCIQQWHSNSPVVCIVWCMWCWVCLSLLPGGWLKAGWVCESTVAL